MFFKLLSGDLIELVDESKELYTVQLGRIIGVLPLNIVLEKSEDETMYYVIVNEHPHKHKEWEGGYYSVIIDDKIEYYTLLSVEISRKNNYIEDWDVYHFDYLTNGEIFFLQKDATKEYFDIDEVMFSPKKYYHSLSELIYDLYSNRYGENDIFYKLISCRVIMVAGMDIQKDTLSYLLNVFEKKV